MTSYPEDRNFPVSATPFTPDQVKGPVERVVVGGIAFALGYLANQFKLSAETTSTVLSWAPDIGALILVAGASFRGWWINRPTAIKQSALEIPHTMLFETKPGVDVVQVADTVAQIGEIKRVLAPQDVADVTSHKVQTPA